MRQTTPPPLPSLPQPKRRLRRLFLLGSVAIAGLAIGAAGSGTYAAFTATASNAGNVASAGTLALADNDSGAAMFNETDLSPGTRVSRCIRVTSTGSLPGRVRLYGTAGGTGLAAFTGVKITRGTMSSPSFPSCSTFTAESTDYSGYGPGVMYAGTLADLPGSFATGVVDVPGSPVTWSTGDSHDYRIDMVVGDNRSAEGKTATATLTWESRDLSEGS